MLEAGDGSVTSPFSGKVINCTVDKEEPARGGEFCKDWWAFRGGKEGRRREAKAAAADSKGSDNNSDAAGAGGGSGSRDGDGAPPGGEGKDGGRRPKSGASDDEAGDAASSGSTMYPPHEFLTRAMVKTAVGGKMGKRSLLAEDLRKLLYLGGLEDIGQITYGDVADIFTSAGNVLRSRCGKKDFSWAGACPLSLLANVWSTAGIKDVVDGTDFVPPHHRSAKGQSMQKKRLVLCVAAHLSPFYATVFEQHFVAVRASGRKKRFMAKDPFADSKKQAKKIRKREGKGNGGKLTKEEQLAAAASARLRLEKDLRPPRPQRMSLQLSRPLPLPLLSGKLPPMPPLRWGLTRSRRRAPRWPPMPLRRRAPLAPVREAARGGPCPQRRQCLCARWSG